MRGTGRAEVTLRYALPAAPGARARVVYGSLALEPPDRVRLDVPASGERIVADASGGAWLQPATKQLLRFGPPPYRQRLETFLALRRELNEHSPQAEYFDLRYRGRIYAKEPAPPPAPAAAVLKPSVPAPRAAAAPRPAVAPAPTPPPTVPAPAPPAPGAEH